MFECLSFILQQLINILKMLFTLDVGFTNLGTVFCIVFILFPMILAIIQFIKTSFVEELDEVHDSGGFKGLRDRFRYVGKHEYVGKHNSLRRRKGGY